MAFYSSQCIACEEPSKQCIGEYRGKDEKGKYSGTLYLCDNMGCKVRQSCQKTQKPSK